VTVETVEGTEYLTGQLVELDADGQEKEDGIRVEETSISLGYAKDDETRERFTGATPGSRVIFNPANAYPNKIDLAAMLDIDKARAGTLTSNFAFTIGEIQRPVPARLNQAFFDRVCEPGTVNSEQEFRERVKADMAARFRQRSDTRFCVDARDKMLKKNEEIVIPKDFLKRWIVTISEGLTEESVEADFAEYKQQMEWVLIKHAMQQEYNLRVTEEELLETAHHLAFSQLRQYYGPQPFTLENVAPIVKRMMDNEQEREKLSEHVYDEKVFATIKENVKLEEQELSREDFDKLFTTQTK
jgi:trigger factor